MAVAALTPSAARADARELYTLLGYQGGVSHYRLAATSDAAVTSYSGAFDLTVYYGVWNALHLGGRLRLSSNSDVPFRSAEVTDPNGSRSRGDVFLDHRALGVGGVAVYRVDSGFALAPVFELGAGLTVHQVRNVAQVRPDGTSTVPLNGSSNVAMYGSGALLLEYRWRDRWLASAGVTVQAETAGPTPWSFFFPLRVGYIWWQ